MPAPKLRPAVRHCMMACRLAVLRATLDRPAPKQQHCAGAAVKHGQHCPGLSPSGLQQSAGDPQARAPTPCSRRPCSGRRPSTCRPAAPRAAARSRSGRPRGLRCPAARAALRQRRPARSCWGGEAPRGCACGRRAAASSQLPGLGLSRRLLLIARFCAAAARRHRSADRHAAMARVAWRYSYGCGTGGQAAPCDTASRNRRGFCGEAAAGKIPCDTDDPGSRAFQCICMRPGDRSRQLV